MKDDYARIFLLSHMRAYTSLAGHILGSHPRINGYFEMHISYDDAAALDKQFEVFQEYEAIKDNSRYIFDKLLHNRYRLTLNQLGLTEIKILVALLEPARAIRSIVSLFAKKTTDQRYALPVEAANYYIERIEALADFCGSASDRYYYYDAELFRSAPELLLPTLSDWLDLDTPLVDRYQTFSQTGKARMGDSSTQIYSGRIERTGTDYSHIRIPDAELSRALATYRECRQTIIENARDSITSG